MPTVQCLRGKPVLPFLAGRAAGACLPIPQIMGLLTAREEIFRIVGFLPYSFLSFEFMRDTKGPTTRHLFLTIPAR